MRKKLYIFAIIFSLFVAGCTNKEEIDDSKINVVTSFYPMYVATSNIVDGVSDVSLSNLTAATTGCLHDYQITTADMIKLSKADILVINGDGMENFIQKAISTYPELDIINASEGIKENHEEILGIHEENETIHVNEESGEKEDEHSHEHGENSHYWVSISLYIEQIKNIKDGLIKLNPENKEKYEENAQNYIEKLELLKAQMHEKLDDVENKKIVTFHEAFEYFAEEFDLEIAAVIEREPGTYPSSRDLARIVDLIGEKDIKAIFVEPQYSRSAADTIAQETGIKVYTLDPIVTGKLSKDSYINIMQKNLEVLEEALGE